MLSLLLTLLFAGQPAAAPVRLAAKAWGEPVEIEIRSQAAEKARELTQRALAEIAEMERLTDAERPDGGLSVLNAAAGRGAQRLDPRLLAALTRAREFCFWSDGAHGPLGRDLYSLWGLRAPVAAPPSAESVEQAASRTACTRLSLDLQHTMATLAEGSGLDLWGFAQGQAVDRAVEILRQGGTVNGFVRIGAVQRGFGDGPNGKGWPVTLPQVPGLEEPGEKVFLRDQALAVASQADHPLQGSASSSYVNQRTGLPAQGVLATLAATELAADAQGLAAALLIAGPRDGQLRLGSLRPRPSARWLLGNGAGAPLQVDYRWSALSRR